MLSTRFAFLALATLLLLQACKPSSTPNVPEIELDEYVMLSAVLDIPERAYAYSEIELPNFLSVPPVVNTDNTPAGNPITDEGATLGRVLFYDTKLSANNTIACASCHFQENSFTDTQPLSRGLAGELTGRHSMSLAKARYYENGHFFWDERAASLEEQTLLPIQDHIEMGLDLETLEEKLAGEYYYHILFHQAFGDSRITSERVSLALSQFVRSMLSFNSKYDEGVAQLPPGPPNPNQDIPGFSVEDNLGRAIYLDPARFYCAVWHRTDLFIGDQASNNGLDRVLVDNGLGDVTGNAADNGKFKVPSLRNVALTNPYMHDGRFASLRQVVNFYNNGVQPHPNLDPRLRVPGTNQPRRLNLNPAEVNALVAFMETLTDESFVEDVRFSDPFK